MNKILLLFFIGLALAGCSVGGSTKSDGQDADSLLDADSIHVKEWSGEKYSKGRLNNEEKGSHYTTRREENDLVIYTPDYSSIDLVCERMPDKTRKDVILCVEAAFTGELLKEFKHSNILGDHVCAGTRYKGTGCKRNTGAFVHYNDKWKFLYKGYSKELDVAARNGGMGFCQELMIHGGERVQTIRNDSNKNEFRALCELNGKLCVIDSKGVSTFGDFIRALLNVGVREAIYLDMGQGWNYSWWRDEHGIAHEIHAKKIPYTTNWITFYGWN